MFAARRAAQRTFAARLYSTESPKKSLKELVAELRSRADVSPIQAGQALKASDMDVSKALVWLEKSLAESAVKKAAKVEGREANEGMIGTAVLSSGSTSARPSGVRAAMVELNCETDFVARNDIFAQLLDDIAHTAAFMSEPVDSDKFLHPFSLDALRDAPLLSKTPEKNGKSTVADAMRDLTGRVGEKISLRRALAVVRDPFPPSQRDIALRIASRVHQSVNNPRQGRIGNLAVLALKSPRLANILESEAFRADLSKLCLSLGNQIIGFPTTSIRSPTGTRDEEGALYDQPFAMFMGEGNDQPVQTFLRTWAAQRGLVESSEQEGGLEVLEFAKWTVAESI